MYVMSDVRGAGFKHDHVRVAPEDSLVRGVPRIPPPVPQDTAVHKASHQSSVVSRQQGLRTEKWELKADKSVRLYN
jgi:hypothetical protein